MVRRDPATHPRGEVESAWGKRLDDPRESGLGRVPDEELDFVLPTDGADAAVPGSADHRTVRQRVKAGEIDCPVPGCGPYASVVARAGCHHFRHRGSPGASTRPGHDPESLAHQEAKQLLAQWLRVECADELEELRLDEGFISTVHGRVKPDVYVRLNSGLQLAIEYQHSPGKQEDFTRRVNAYRAAGIISWWIFSSRKETCDAEPPRSHVAEAFVTFSEAQRSLVDSRVFVAFLDLQRQRLGVPLPRRTLPLEVRGDEHWEARPVTSRAYFRQLDKGWRSAALIGSPLSRCHLDLEKGRVVSLADELLRQDSEGARREIDVLRAQARAAAVRRAVDVQLKALDPTALAAAEGEAMDARNLAGAEPHAPSAAVAPLTDPGADVSASLAASPLEDTCLRRGLLRPSVSQTPERGVTGELAPGNRGRFAEQAPAPGAPTVKPLEAPPVLSKRRERAAAWLRRVLLHK